MDLLRSSILGHEFVNYRKSSFKNDRIRFSNKIRNMGLGYIPIIIDSIDNDISTHLANTMIYNNESYCQLDSQKDFLNTYNINFSKYGRPLVYHMDNKLTDILQDIKTLLKNNQRFTHCQFIIGLEDGTFPAIESDIGTVYKLHRNQADKILYLLVTKEKTSYDYIMSIIHYIKNNIIKMFTNT